MYKVQAMTGSTLAKFGHLTMARYFARRNMPCQIVNRAGKVVPIN